MIDTEKAVRRIAMTRVLAVLGSETDGRYAVCPKCKRKSLRIIQPANRVKCPRCFKRPATNIDLAMRVLGIPKDEAIEFVQGCAGVRAQPAQACAATSTDIEEYRQFVAAQAMCANDVQTHTADVVREYIERAHGHKNKYRGDSIATTHAIALCCIYSHAEDIDQISGLTMHDTAKFAEEHIGLRVLTAKRLKVAEAMIRRCFYRADLDKTTIFNKAGTLVCQNRNLIVPVMQDRYLVGIVCADLTFQREASSSLTPFAHYLPGAGNIAVAQALREAISYCTNMRETLHILDAHAVDPDVLVRSIADKKKEAA